MRSEWWDWTYINAGDWDRDQSFELKLDRDFGTSRDLLDQLQVNVKHELCTGLNLDWVRLNNEGEVIQVLAGSIRVAILEVSVAKGGSGSNGQGKDEELHDADFADLDQVRGCRCDPGIFIPESCLF